MYIGISLTPKQREMLSSQYCLNISRKKETVAPIYKLTYLSRHKTQTTKHSPLHPYKKKKSTQSDFSILVNFKQIQA